MLPIVKGIEDSNLFDRSNKFEASPRPQKRSQPTEEKAMDTLLPTSKTEIFDINMCQVLTKSDKVNFVEKKQLRTYYKHKENGNHVKVVYEYGTGWRQLRLGRLYANGLQMFSREVRNALASKYYWDVDVVCCFPTLITQIADRYGVKVPAITDMVANREETLNQIMAMMKVDRAEAKERVNAVIMGGDHSRNRILLRIHNECETLQTRVAEAYPEWYKNAQKLKKPFPERTTLSFLLQQQESKIIYALETYLRSIGRDLDVYIHDGGLVRKLDGETECPAELLEGAAEAVKKDTGFAIQFISKPMTHTFEFDAEQSDILPASLLIDDSYAAEEFYKIAKDSLCRVGPIVNVLNPDTKRWSDSKHVLKMLIHQHRAKLVFRQESALGVRTFNYGGEAHLINNLIAKIEVCVPAGELPLVFQYTLTPPVADKSIYVKTFDELVNNHVHHKPLLFKYTLNYVADTLQNPKRTPKVALVCSGVKGSGKDYPFDFFGRWVLGPDYYTNYQKTAQFVDKYDIGKAGKFMVKLEEANRKLCVEYADDIKTTISAERGMFNKKFVADPIEIPSYTRFIFTTNSENPFDMTDEERRFVFLATSTAKRGDKMYWGNVRRLMDTPEAGRAVADYLLSLDLTDFNVNTLPPNEYQDAIVDDERTTEDRFIRQLREGEIAFPELFGMYQSYCSENGHVALRTSKHFSCSLTKMMRDGVVGRRKTHGDVVYWRV